MTRLWSKRSSCTLKAKRLESQTIEKSLGASKLKGRNMINKIGQDELSLILSFSNNYTIYKLYKINVRKIRRGN